MATFGELVPGPKLRKESEDDSGSGEGFEPVSGPLDLDAGVIYLRKRPTPTSPAAVPVVEAD
ncbi:hypothetical protein [Actinokineospora sp. NBRC 105648]|uniref:hypothetical protein n=1 Tax=Actinokineospora sp. NBRC 105648 TaxID=3032206 RepID=UPI0024A1299B|nr:hypothetical protein [Actinokineospora sp. NBRC 105648]GLZ43771.1 hypothetical protein Acsp05_73950 [Actinokineospora sp. NBRC 105648]